MARQDGRGGYERGTARGARPRSGAARETTARGAGRRPAGRAGDGAGGARGARGGAARAARGASRARDRGGADARRRDRLTRRGRRSRDPRAARSSAESRLQKFRQGSRLAVAITALVLVVWGVDGTDAAGAQAPAAPPAGAVAADSLAADSAAVDSAALADSAPVLAELTDTSAVDARREAAEATTTLRELGRGAARIAPKLGIALLVLVVAGILAKLANVGFRRGLRSWERGEAIGALVAIGIWLIGIAAALSVVAGDARTLVGSVGLIGLALSWALQGPIESFTGWLLNSFRGYYRIGDRVNVGEVFGDVHSIDLLTTTVWEAGGPGKPVQGAQPTGALVTFPNSEVLRTNVVNYTRDFPYVWDELTVGVTNESDIRYALDVVQRTATRVLGDVMAEPAATYRTVLGGRGLPADVPAAPQVFASATEAWTDLTVRYLVPVRERRHWASELTLAFAEETARPEHQGKIATAYPFQRIALTRARVEPEPEGKPVPI